MIFNLGIRDDNKAFRKTLKIRKCMKPNILVIIPAFNEAGSIGKVIDDIPKLLVREIVVVNNASSD